MLLANRAPVRALLGLVVIMSIFPNEGWLPHVCSLVFKASSARMSVSQTTMSFSKRILKNTEKLTQKEASAQIAKSKKMCAIAPETANSIHKHAVNKSDTFAG